MNQITMGGVTAVDVPPGAVLELTVVEGRQMLDLCPAGFHQGLTRNQAGWRRFGRPSLALGLVDGDELLDGDGAALMRLVASPGPGPVDVLYPGCWSELYPDGRPGCRDLIAGALGIPRGSLGGVISAFGATPTVSDGGFHGWESTVATPGMTLALEALVACRVAVSACPDDGIPGHDGGTLAVTVHEGAIG